MNRDPDMDTGFAISFRPVVIEHDATLLYAWLGDEDVHARYDEGEHTIENYRQRFAPEETTHRFIAEVQAKPVGYVQVYRLADEPE